MDPLAEHVIQIDRSPFAYAGNNPILFVDPDGRIIGTLIGTVVGGAAGAYDAYKNGKDILSGAAEGAVAGAVAGAIVDATVATGGGALVVIGAAAAGGAIGNVAGDVVGQVVSNARANGGDVKKAMNNVNFDNTGKKALAGAASGAAGGVFGAAVGKALGAAAQSTKSLQATMSKNISETATTLTKMGANSQTTQKAVDKITQGMGTAGRNTSNNIAKISSATAMSTESAVKSVEAIRSNQRLQ